MNLTGKLETPQGRCRKALQEMSKAELEELAKHIEKKDEGLARDLREYQELKEEQEELYAEIERYALAGEIDPKELRALVTNLYAGSIRDYDAKETKVTYLLVKNAKHTKRRIN